MISNLPSIRRKLAENHKRLRERIDAACAAARRDPADLTLVAVTKGVNIDVIRQALDIGLLDLGENRAQQLNQRAGMIHEFAERRAVLGVKSDRAAQPRWHMIGHLQRNKVKLVVPWATLVHSIDSLRLAEEIHLTAEKLGRTIDVLLQVNVSGERSKFGVAVGAAPHLAEQFRAWPHVRLVGLMTMLPADATDPAEQRTLFDRLREVFDDMRTERVAGPEFRHLSMGMSNDFEAAILAGATILRIGTTLFAGLLTPQSPEPEEPD